MNTRAVVAIAFLAALGATAAYADRGMTDADTNGDGYVSVEELKSVHSARIEEQFARMDTNADGLLSEDEMKTARNERRGDQGKRPGDRRHEKRDPAEMFSRLDADGSGGLSMAELEGKRFSPDAAAFQAADADGSGELDAAEMHALAKARWEARRGPGPEWNN